MQGDLDRLRRDRLSKVQTAMRAHGVGALLLTNPIHIRYATGVTCMTLWTSVNLARYALVPVQGDPMIFEYSKALFLAKEVWPRSRAATAWQSRFSGAQVLSTSRRWAEEIAELLKEWGLAGERVATDPLDHFGYQALLAAGLRLTDADETMEAARLTKTPDEIALLKRSCTVAEAGLAELERSIRPGFTENELLSIFWGKMQALGGEYCSTRLLVCGEKTNPWFHEAGDNRVQIGDLVGIDTDMIGPEGYLCDISRTFLCGDKANPDQKEAYRVAYDFIQGLIDLCRVGQPYRKLVELAPKYPAEYGPLGYSCMIHGSGVDDETPFLPFPHDLPKATVADGHLQKDMVLSVEFYAGKPGKRDGVKLEEQIWITDAGPALLSKYPFEEKLL